MKRIRNPITARARFDTAPCSHPRQMPRLGTREAISAKEEVLLLDVRLRQALGEPDYALCRARELGYSWAQIAEMAAVRFGGSWSPQRAATRCRRARRKLDEFLARQQELEAADATPPEPLR